MLYFSLVESGEGVGDLQCLDVHWLGRIGANLTS